MNEFIKFMQDNNTLGTYERFVSFKNLTTYHTGGNASCVVFPNDVDSLVKILDEIKKLSLSYKVFGNGSNILASDDDYDGVVIKLSKLNNYKIDNDILDVDAGCNLTKVSMEVSKNGYSGLEFASGIPGSVGGAIYMNAGAYLKAMSDVLIDATLLDDKMNIITLKNEEMGFSYRNSILNKNNYICLKARIKLEKKDAKEIMMLINDRLHRRIETQPLEYPSAGSVFRNPVDDHAGRLIEECGLKGFDYKGAEISDKHANFIINKNNATSSAIKYLMDLASDKVYEKFNIRLHREQELFNFK